MVLDNIEKLIEKYENAETTLQEEQQLKDYFSQETVAPHLEMYRPMFMYFLHTQNEQFTKDVPLKPEKTRTLYKWISVAAVAVLMIGAYLTFPRGATDPTPDQIAALEETKKAFAMLSSNFKKGTDNMDALGLMSESFNKGTENIAYLGEFSSTTNKIFKNE